MAEINVHGASRCPDCKRSKKFLAEHRIPYEWIDIDDDADGLRYVETLQKGGRTIPTIVCPDGGHPRRGRRHRRGRHRPQRHGRSGRRDGAYRQLPRIPGRRRWRGARRQGHRAGSPLQRRAGGGSGGGWRRPGDGRRRRAAEQRPAGLHARRSHRQRQLVPTPGRVRRGRPDRRRSPLLRHLRRPLLHWGGRASWIGGGNSGLEEGLFLSQFAKRIRIVEFAAELKASKLQEDKVRSHPQFTVDTNTQVTELKGRPKRTEVVARDRTTGEEHHRHPAAAFVFIGLDPNTAFVKGTLDLDRRAFVETRGHLTSMPGVFAAGDVRAGSTKQLGAAVGEGISALLEIRQYLQDHHHVNA